MPPARVATTGTPRESASTRTRPNASATLGKIGNAVLDSLIKYEYQGVVYPVNPNREAVHGIQAYPDVASLPNTPDLAVIAVPAVDHIIAALAQASPPPRDA